MKISTGCWAGLCALLLKSADAQTRAQIPSPGPPGGASGPTAVAAHPFPLAPKLLPESPGADPNQNAFKLRLLGDPGKAYEIQASTNLKDWTPLATNRTSRDGFFVWSDSGFNTSQPRFYRAVLSALDAVPLSTDFFRGSRILIKPKRGADLAGLHLLLGGRVLRTFSEMDGWQVVQISAEKSVPEIILEYRHSGLVEQAEPDYAVRLSRTPNDPRFLDGSLWGLHNTGQSGGVSDADLDAPEAWDVQFEARDIIVAVIDTGVRYTHEDLAANMWVNPGETGSNLIGLDKKVNALDDDGNGYVDDVHGINAILGTGNPLDDHGHGTHLSGTIGGVGGNGLGGAGVAWRVRLMACKFLNPRGEGSISDAITCIDYARRHGAKIINASWGSPAFQSAALRDAIDSVRRAGILWVAATGNDGQDNDLNPLYPASYDLDNIVAVAATERTDKLAPFSNYGATSVDLAAPGDFILSAWNQSNNAYEYLRGTSMAAAYVSGASALLRARYPQESYSQIKDRLLSSIDPLPSLSGKSVTGGRLNLHQALTGTASPSVVKAEFTASPMSGPAPLTVQFTDQSSGNLSRWDWDFGDGAAHSGERSPAHVYHSPGQFTATLTVTGTVGSTSSKSQLIAVNSAVVNYEIQPASFNWIDPGAMSALSLGDDGVSGAISLPFDISFYGMTYRQLFVGANGLLGFAAAGLSSAANTDLPNATAPNAIIAPYWADLNPSQGGSVRVGATGTAPNRRYVISWVDVPTKGSLLVQTRMTFQAALIESANQILFQYQQIEPNRLLGERQTSTTGIENETGTLAAKYTFQENPARLSNRQALLFVPQSSTPPGACADDAGQVHYPDLKTLPPSELAIVIENNRKLLRFSNAAANAGAGPMELFPKNSASGTTGETERLLVLENADTDEAVVTALEILGSSSGTLTTAIDVS
ncbi:MAG: S8 family serine peptidase, partial [Verrucomicrobia bacterium]|nr:S8 family serine peptidase [Verrucomicrobiota bacterium]